MLVPRRHGQSRHAGHDEPPWAYRWQLACIAVTAENPLPGRTGDLCPPAADTAQLQAGSLFQLPRGSRDECCYSIAGGSSSHYQATDLCLPPVCEPALTGLPLS